MLKQSSFHFFANHSKEVAAFGIQLDYLGIVLLMWGSTIPTVYYGFYRDQHLQRCYWAMVSQGLLWDLKAGILIPSTTGILSSSRLCTYNIESKVPPSNLSSIPYRHVCRSRIVCTCLCRSWYHAPWFGTSDKTHAPGSDGTNGSFESDRRQCLCCEGICTDY